MAGLPRGVSIGVACSIGKRQRQALTHTGIQPRSLACTETIIILHVWNTTQCAIGRNRNTIWLAAEIVLLVNEAAGEGSGGSFRVHHSLVDLVLHWVLPLPTLEGVLQMYRGISIATVEERCSRSSGQGAETQRCPSRPCATWT